MGNARKKVWIVDDEWYSHELEREIYAAHDIDLLVTRSETLQEDFERFGKYADGIVAQVGFKLDKALIDELEQCKIIAASGVGYNHIDLGAAKEKGIYVTNLPDYCMGEVADHTVALALLVLRRLRAYNEQVLRGDWNPLQTLPIMRLQGRTLGLLGFGRIAREVAKRFKGFGVKIIAHDDYAPDAVFEAAGVERVRLEDLLRRSTVLSLHVPLTKETERLINYERLKEMPEGAVLINTCRGEVICEDGLLRAIQEGHIAGAGLDVLSEEPPSPDHPLIQLEEVFVTPHASYVSVESEYELRSRTSLNVIAAIQGKQPDFILN